MNNIVCHTTYKYYKENYLFKFVTENGLVPSLNIYNRQHIYCVHPATYNLQNNANITLQNAHSIEYSPNSQVIHNLKTYFRALRRFFFKTFFTLLFGVIGIFTKSSII